MDFTLLEERRSVGFARVSAFGHRLHIRARSECVDACFSAGWASEGMRRSRLLEYAARVPIQVVAAVVCLGRLHGLILLVVKTLKVWWRTLQRLTATIQNGRNICLLLFGGCRASEREPKFSGWELTGWHCPLPRVDRVRKFGGIYRTEWQFKKGSRGSKFS